MLMMQTKAELYPVGTDIVLKYVRQEGSGFTSGTYFDADGEIVAGSYATESDYIPINPSYTYEKNGYRLSRACWYDSNKNFISITAQNNTSVQTITNIPTNARFLRFATVQGISTTRYEITRIA